MKRQMQLQKEQAKKRHLPFQFYTFEEVKMAVEQELGYEILMKQTDAGTWDARELTDIIVGPDIDNDGKPDVVTKIVHRVPVFETVLDKYVFEANKRIEKKDEQTGQRKGSFLHDFTGSSSAEEFA